MKICFLGDASSIHIHKWVKYFKALGWEIYVISFKKYHIEGVKVINLGINYIVKERGGNCKYPLYIPKIKKLLKKIKPDIVNAHYLTSYGFLGASTKVTPLVLTAWGTDILVTPKKNLLYRRLIKFTLGKADIITSDSENMSKAIVELLDGKETKILTVPMGVDVDLFKGERTYNIDTLTILSLRTLNANSNIDLIIDGFIILLNKYPNSKLYIGNEGELKENLIKNCQDKGILEKVEFLGFVDRKTTIGLLKKCDYNISIPTSDGTSVTLLEAMSSGMYPIVSDIPANCEWIENNKNGSVVGFDSQEIADCIIKSYYNIEYRKSVSDTNSKIIHERAELKNNMEIIVKEFIKIVDETKSKNLLYK